MEQKKNTLYELTGQMAALENALEESGGELTPEVEQLLSETGDSLRAKVDSYNALLRIWDGRSKIIAEEIKRLQGLKKTLENSMSRVREHVLDVMDANGIQRIDGNLCKMFTVERISMGVDEEMLLKPYRAYLARCEKKLPAWLSIDYKISKTELSNTYRPAGITVDNLPEGLTFEPKKSLTIK